MDKKIILIDLSFLITAITNKIDINYWLRREYGKNYELVILRDSIEELENISKKNKSKIRKVFKLIEKFIETHCRIENYNSKYEPVDMKIIEYAKKHRCIVATNDKYLARILVSEKIPVIFINIKKRKIEFAYSD
ncbi:MAG: hypothetical protein DRJ52_01130 [Thermoprotei archaeon]|nr:MAG: hypothetical protein DRJ52_01130 [Thermoprotei archaeon]RLF01059.1 MAG: hypothetical protein DRJ63_00565 [Thermoprotei archaeon]